MTKRKKSFGDQPNLKQFRSEIRQMTKHGGTPVHSEGETKHKGPKQTRKEKRKEARIIKKSRRNAFCRHLPIPTTEDREKAKKEAEKADRIEKKKEKLKKLKKKQKKKQARKKKEEVDTREEELRMANMWDDKEIRNLEKKLGLDKRKKKDTLPQSFHNDGLDYILDVVNSDKLQVMSQMQQDEDDSGEEEGNDFGLMADGDGSESEDIDEDILQGFDSDDNEEDVENSDKDSVEPDTDNDDVDDNIKNSKELKKEKNGKDEAKDSGTVLKKEKWEELADKIKEIADKKKKEKGNKKNKKVTFDESLDQEKDISSDCSEDDKVDVGGFEFDGSEDSGDDINNFDGVDSESEDGDEIDIECGEEDDKEFKQDFENISGKLTETDRYRKENKTKSGNNSVTEKGDLTEDIYGRLRDASGNIVKDNKPAGGQGAYVPPAKRLQMAGSLDEKRKILMDRLQKQLKGLVNRVSEANMQAISGQIEELYLSNSRADVSESLVDLMTSACITPVLTPDRLSMELMMLVAILHGNVGSEVGAVFLQQFVKRFDALREELSYGPGKEIDNVVVLLAHLYNFKVVHSVLIFDILKIMTDSFTEKDVELILLLLRHVGFTLRKDNAAELKELILLVQSKASSEVGSKLADQSRVRFMLDVIMAIRNNNMRKIPNYDPEHLDHLRKLIKSFIRGGHFGDNQLHIGLGDLLRAEEQGKWWLVGSAWAGKEEKAETQDKSNSGSVLGSLTVSSRLQELARKQRMNTELRRNIFFVIMTSEDFLDAFEKLLRLGLKSSQQQEIVLVIIDCCVQEKKYNPFYAHLSQKFCEHHRTYQMSFQFTIWDRFKEIGQLSESRRCNFAKLLTHLFASSALSLSILKVVQFGTLEKSMVRLLKQIMTDFLTDQSESTIQTVFTRVAQLDKLRQLHEGLRLFLRHFLIGSKKAEANDLLVERVEMVDRILSRGKSHVLL